jgi:phosphoketolase
MLPRGGGGRSGGAYDDEQVTIVSETSAQTTSDELARVDAWWRAANYLSVASNRLGRSERPRDPITMTSAPNCLAASTISRGL